ncbi:hypothetical protein AB0C96_38515, partial [Streptomyces sp. NPDC048506]|uniref:hypothetical protein n=1 Tax=Streptomyces sp. NPDC048506 TaxID=3155028 RepID=UPI003435EC89
ALVAAVAASHDGTVRAENTGRGAVVTLDIPCWRKSAQGSTTASPRAPRAPTGRADHQAGWR